MAPILCFQQVIELDDERIAVSAGLAPHEGGKLYGPSFAGMAITGASRFDPGQFLRVVMATFRPKTTSRQHLRGQGAAKDRGIVLRSREKIRDGLL